MAPFLLLLNLFSLMLNSNSTTGVIQCMKTLEGEIVTFDDLPIPSGRLKVGRLDVKDYCGTWAWESKKTHDKIPFYCGSANCGRRRCKVRFWKKRVQIISCSIMEHKLNKFFTLTLDRKKVDQNSAWDEIPYIWNKARTVLKRKYPTFRFISVLEAHKDTRYPHIHGFTNIWIKQREWSNHWSSCGGGPVVWIEQVTGNVEEYVNKQIDVANYVGKANILDAKCMLKARARSFWRSQKMKCSFELDKTPSEWVLLKQKIFSEDENG